MPKIKGPKRDKVIKVSVTESEYLELQKRATRTQIAAWLRQIGLGATPIHPIDPEFVRAIGRIGSNLNQLTKSVNKGEFYGNRLLQKVEEIQKELTDTVQHFRSESQKKGGGDAGKNI